MKRYLFSLVPILPGLALLALEALGLWTGPVIYLRASLSNLVLILGGVGSLTVALGLAYHARQASRLRQAVARQQDEQSEAHRRFVRRLDHEIKNPVTAIRAGLANLPQGAEGPVLTSVRGQVDRLARLSADLRKLADLESQPIEREPVHLDQLLGELCELAQQRPEAAARQLRLTLPAAPWPLPPVGGDPDLLFLALHNLVDNAFKFTSAGDTIEIRASEDGSSVAVEVADTGPGIPPDELAHVGEELYRGSVARGIEGSGLGLALAQAIANRHGGTLVVRSRVGHGSVLTLRLPVPR